MRLSSYGQAKSLNQRHVLKPISLVPFRSSLRRYVLCSIRIHIKRCDTLSVKTSETIMKALALAIGITISSLQDNCPI
jgi:hypothetical protein